jgi:hypothetical protein
MLSLPDKKKKTVPVDGGGKNLPEVCLQVFYAGSGLPQVLVDPSGKVRLSAKTVNKR